MYIVRSIFSYGCIVIIGIIFFLPALMLIAILPESLRRDNTLIFWLLHKTYAGIVYSTFLPVRVIGKKHMVDEPAIIIANHQSALDIPVLGYICYAHPHVWYVLDYYARKPVLGFFVRRMGISITREVDAKSARALITGMRLMAHNHRHTLLFPEGARYVDGSTHPFKGGFALLARKTGRPVVPVYLKNLGKILPPDSFIMHAVLPIEVIIGPVYYYKALETDEQFIARVHAWFDLQSA